MASTEIVAAGACVVAGAAAAAYYCGKGDDEDAPNGGDAQESSGGGSSPNPLGGGGGGAAAAQVVFESVDAMEAWVVDGGWTCLLIVGNNAAGYTEEAFATLTASVRALLEAADGGDYAKIAEFCVENAEKTHLILFAWKLSNIR